MRSSNALAGSATRFFGLTLCLTVPFYVLGASGARLPGLPILPASALMAFVPLLAACILVYHARGARGISAAVQVEVDVRSLGGAGWYVTAWLFMPVVCALEFVVLRLTGTPIPLPQISLGQPVFLFLAFFIGALGEELGWQGYAYPRLRSRLNAVRAGVLLGAIWALWHVIPFAQMGRSTDWIIWHSLSAVAMRITMIWLFESVGRRVLIAVLFHTMINVCWALFPESGSFYDPFVTFLVLAPAAGVITVVWGPDALCKHKKT